MRKSLIITVVIVLLCLCGCEAVVTVPESPELTRASEMLLTTTAAEESTDELRHTVTLGTDIFGNIQRLDNALNSFQEKLTACEAQLENTKVQLENAKLEVQKPFPQEDELKTKTARLNELNAMLNLNKRENEIVDGERAEEEPSRSSDDRER